MIRALILVLFAVLVGNVLIMVFVAAAVALCSDNDESDT